MTANMTNFIRTGTPFEVFQIERNYSEERQQISLTLKQIYEDYIKEGVIHTLCKYENEFMSRIYLHRLIDLGIIKRLTDDNGNIQYEWIDRDNPD
jgi:hypothetical protein